MYCCPISPSKQSPYPSAHFLFPHNRKNQPKESIFASETYFGFSNARKRASVSLASLGNGNHLVNVSPLEHDDGFYIRCVEIARKAVGHTSPNPMVGCVIVKDGKIVGEGFHPKAGQPHAESCYTCCEKNGLYH